MGETILHSNLSEYGFPSLTSRQRKIISHLVAAPDQKTAAEWLGITDRQISRHVDRIQKAFGVETKNQAIILAALSGQLDPKALPAGISRVAQRAVRANMGLGVGNRGMILEP